MKKNIVGKIITILLIVSTTIMIGITIGICMLSNIDFDKYDNNPVIEIAK